jgi:hypothetical protein
MKNIKNKIAIALSAVIVSTGVAVATASTSYSSTPTAANQAATDVTDASANGNCIINPGGQEVEVWVVYKKSSGSWSNSADVKRADATELYTGSSNVSVTIFIPGTDVAAEIDHPSLSSSTSYDFRCKVKPTASGSSTVTDTVTKTFSTSADTLGVALDEVIQGEKGTYDVDGNFTPDPNGGLDPTMAFASCEVDPVNNGDTTKTWIVWKKSTDTWSAGPVLGGRLEDSMDITTGLHLYNTAVMDSLQPNTSYDWRCKADATGYTTVTSSTGTFTTPSN